MVAPSSLVYCMKQAQRKLCFSVIDFSGRQVVFTEKRRIKKAKLRPILNAKWFTDRIKETIRNPDFVYTDIAEPQQKHVYYLREFGTSNSTRYTKVVVWLGDVVAEVVTAYRPDYVKEKGKKNGNLIYGQAP